MVILKEKIIVGEGSRMQEVYMHSKETILDLATALANQDRETAVYWDPCFSRA